MLKPLMLLPLAAFALVAAKHAPHEAKVKHGKLVEAPVVSVVAPAAIAADPANKLILDLSTGGHVVIQLRPDIAPHSVARIQALAQQHFYDGLKFHRVIAGFMAQGGDPKGDGTGGSALPDVKAEFSDMPHLRGSVAMARAESPDSANSQFYIMFGPKASLDRKYTVVGRVVEGMSAVDGIAQGEPPEAPTTISHATLGGPIAVSEVLPAPVVAAAPPVVAAPVVAAPLPALLPTPVRKLRKR
ncbi:peptidylprolyl isomerase [Sphingomonas sp.]|uniref:peptidylprolyl isomerase n=1 Tax=Sphingomonas sp. TaxID=28214 RepID=UPI00286B18FC|nr:peptidylprolyl isomerase [Sphingomonas sp.]